MATFVVFLIALGFAAEIWRRLERRTRRDRYHADVCLRNQYCDCRRHYARALPALRVK